MKSDIIIIGAGPGGYHTAAYAVRQGLSVTIIEKEHVGGTCLNCGCIPTKALCHDAEAVEAATRILGARPQVDFARIATRKREVVEKLRQDVETLMAQPGITLVRGNAVLAGGCTVSVDGEEYQADNIIIATGSRPKMPPVEGCGLPGVMTSTGLLDASSLPQQLCIVGAGVIGLEFASVFNSFGSDVTVVEFMKECLPPYDQDISRRVRKAMEKRGVKFVMQAAVSSIGQCGGKLQVAYESKRKPGLAEADAVLIATGRAANTEGLGLEAVGVATERGCIVVDDNMQTSVKGVYAVGDVNGRCMLAHAALMQGMRCVNHILGRADDIRLDFMPSAVFSNPEAAAVGLTEAQCREAGMDYAVRKIPFRANGRAVADEADGGLLKLITGDGGKLLGCHVCGPHAADIVQEASALMAMGCTSSQLYGITHIHPTIAELLRDAAE